MTAAPNLKTIGGRLRIERNRMGLSQTAAAKLAGLSKRVWMNWEAGTSSPTAAALAHFEYVGADVLFIVTGRPERPIPSAQEPLAGVTVRQALAMLDPMDRHRLLLDLLADELRA